MAFPSRVDRTVFETLAAEAEFGSKRCVESKSKSFFWVASVFERITFVDLGEKAFVENLPKASKNFCFEQ